jgi:hypothetical protein
MTEDVTLEDVWLGRKPHGAYSMYFEAKRRIAKGPDHIWPFLTDKRRLLEGGFGILRIEGEIGPGTRFKLWSEASPKRAFPLRVSEFKPPQRMVWEGGMPFGLFKGVRIFTLKPAMGGSDFHVREDYSGPLSGLVGKSIPDLGPSFEKFADALKSLAEGA